MELYAASLLDEKMTHMELHAPRRFPTNKLTHMELYAASLPEGNLTHMELYPPRRFPTNKLTHMELYTPRRALMKN